jgi:hypothetical protein
MASISGLGLIGAPDLYSASITPGEGLMVGQLVWDGKVGKAFRYILNGAAALVKGNTVQEMVEDTGFLNMTVGTAGVAGDMYLQVTNHDVTITAAQYKGGTIGVYTAGTVTVADEYTIVDVTGTLTTGGALKVWLDRPLRYAYTTSATVNMKRSPWSGVIQQPITTATGMCVGVAIYEVPAEYYGWVQTHGPCTALSDNSTFAVASDLDSMGDAAGAVSVYAAGTGHQRIGFSRTAAASTKGIPIFLQID